MGGTGGGGDEAAEGRGLPRVRGVDGGAAFGLLGVGGGEGGGGGGKAFFERWAEAGLSPPLPHDQPVVLAGKRVGFTSFAACG